MRAEEIPEAAQGVEFVADMRYHGQGYEIPVAMETRDLPALEARFNELHEQLYGFRMPDTPAEIVNLRAVGTGARPSRSCPRASRTAGTPPARARATGTTSASSWRPAIASTDPP